MTGKAFLASLQAWGGVRPLDDLGPLTWAERDAFLAAEVRLPVPGGTDVSTLRTVAFRPPFERESRLLLVDVSRLPAL